MKNKELIKFESASFRILESAKDKTELDQIAEKHMIQVPNKDLSVFKCLFAFVDRENLNGCTLPREEAIKALPSLTGKAVDFDHIRRQTVGYWLEASLEGDSIYAYGVFFKGNHEMAYEELQRLIATSELGVSFESWGAKEQTSEKSYVLRDPEFAGGALLPRTQPAYPGAKVLVMSNDRRDKIKELHESSFSIFDFDTILKVVSETPIPKGEDEYSFWDIEMIDFTEGIVRARVFPGDNRYQINLRPTAKKLTTASQYVESIIKIETTSEMTSQDDKVLIQSNSEETKNKMEEKVKELEKEIANLKDSLAKKEEEVTSLTSDLEASKAKVVEAEKSLEDSKKQNEEAIKVAKENATKVAERKAELADFASEMTEEEILNDDKYENAKLKKEKADLEAKLEEATKTPEKASVNTEMSTGTKGKKKDAFSEKRDRVKNLAFASDEAETE